MSKEVFANHRHEMFWNSDVALTRLGLGVLDHGAARDETDASPHSQDPLRGVHVAAAQLGQLTLAQGAPRRASESIR